MFIISVIERVLATLITGVCFIWARTLASHWSFFRDLTARNCLVVEYDVVKISNINFIINGHKLIHGCRFLETLLLIAALWWSMTLLRSPTSILLLMVLNSSMDVVFQRPRCS